MSSPRNAPEMLRLHGYAVSNYFNIARAALLEKGVAHEIVSERAGQDADFLERSPMGKIPYLETVKGCIAETVAIVEYIDEACHGARLYPVDAFARARMRQTINIVQMYIEAPMRALYPGVFMGGKNSAELTDGSRALLARGLAALDRVVSPGPYLGGEVLGASDLFAFYCLDLAERVSVCAFGDSILARHDWMRPWAVCVAARESSRMVLAGFDEVFPDYLAAKGAAYALPQDGMGGVRGVIPAVLDARKGMN